MASSTPLVIRRNGVCDLDDQVRNILRENPESFILYFINRFADTINTIFKKNITVSYVNNIVGQLPPAVIEENIRRWNHLDSRGDWYEHVNFMKDYLGKRPPYIRQHIIKFFKLSGTASVSLKTEPEKGYIQINSLQITKDTPGVENPASWTGIYFKNVPIKITAVPQPGYGAGLAGPAYNSHS